jgi:hypothetical protein
MALNKRKKLKPVGKMSNQKEFPALTLQQAIDLVIAGKSAEGLRERTLKDYRKDWGYFITWLEGNYEIETVDKLTPHILETILITLNLMRLNIRGTSSFGMTKGVDCLILQSISF